MRHKLLLGVAVLTLSAVSIVSAKSYTVVFSTPVQAGTTQMAAGTYKLEVEGTNAIFTNKETHKSVTVAVKPEDTTTKFDLTSLDTSSEGSTMQVKSIKLGGTKTRLDFAK